MSSKVPRKILAFTSTRSDYDLLSYVYKYLSEDNEFDLQLLVSGMNLSKTYGYAFDEIKKDEIKILSTIETLIDSDTRESRLKSASLLMQNCIHTITHYNPDLILFAGDREDALVAAMTAAYLNIPSIHFFGGDHTTDGNVDNPVRHACSKLSTAHFVMCREHEVRLEKMGEVNGRIFNIGSPALDKLILEKNKTKIELFQELNLERYLKEKIAVLIFHPIIGDEEQAGSQFKNIVDSLLEEGFVVMCGTPNVDSGNKFILNEILKYSSSESNFYSYKNLDRNSFINLLRNSDLLIGNSSAGILEAATLKLRVVNVGQRQVGRMHGGNVIFSNTTKNEIKSAIRKSFTLDHGVIVENVINPYGDGLSSLRAVELIKSIDFKKMLSKKEDALVGSKK